MIININYIGKLSKYLGIFCTYISAFLLVFFLIGINDDRTIYHTFGAFVGVSILVFIGKKIYKLYDYYKMFRHGVISDMVFRKKWISCGVSISVLLIPILFFLVLSVIELWTTGIIISVIPIFLLTPHVILLRKTNHDYININFKVFNRVKTPINRIKLLNRTKLLAYLKSFIITSSHSEIIVACTVIAIIIGLSLGYYSEDCFPIRNAKGQIINVGTDQCEFNYLVGVSAFLISGGISYIISNRVRKNKNNPENASSASSASSANE